MDYFINFGVVLYLFDVTESVSEAFVQIEPYIYIEIAILCQITERGRFCNHAHILMKFNVFLKESKR